jgi:hypothetical protein
MGLVAASTPQAGVSAVVHGCRWRDPRRRRERRAFSACMHACARRRRCLRALPAAACRHGHARMMHPSTSTLARQMGTVVQTKLTKLRWNYKQKINSSCKCWWKVSYRIMKPKFNRKTRSFYDFVFHRSWVMELQLVRTYNCSSAVHTDELVAATHKYQMTNHEKYNGSY